MSRLERLVCCQPLDLTGITLSAGIPSAPSAAWSLSKYQVLTNLKASMEGYKTAIKTTHPNSGLRLSLANFPSLFTALILHFEEVVSGSTN